MRSLERCRYAAKVSLVMCAVVTSLAATSRQDGQSKLVTIANDGRLRYAPADPAGDEIADFSNAGYMGGGVKLPDVPAKATLEPDAQSKDDTARIQQAIESIAKMPAESNGIRGTLLLKRGKYRIEGQLKISASGIVIRGEGEGADGTVLIAAGKKQRDLIEIKGPTRRDEIEKTRTKITNSYVPVGAKSFDVADASVFHVGDTVLVHRVGNAAWIHFIKMDQITPRPGHPDSTKQWQPFELSFDRVIGKVEGRHITIDAPITCAIDEKWGGGAISRYTDERIEQVGVENLRGDSEFDPSITKEEDHKTYPADEEHAMYLLSFDNVKNSWAKNLTAVHFYNGTEIARDQSKWITVQDCSSIDPVSVITGGRRYPFCMEGQLILVQRCYSRDGRHAFVVQARVCGPNVFLDCQSENDHATSEPHHRWSVGGLYDNVHAHMALQDRQWMGSGHGWAGANYVMWNCEGSLVCQQPPTAQNYAIGFVGAKTKGAFDRPDGYWESLGAHVEPKSLYLKQLEDRLGKEAVANIAGQTHMPRTAARGAANPPPPRESHATPGSDS
jgi:hypothetical protein